MVKFLFIHFLFATIMGTAVDTKPSLTYLVREPKLKVAKPPLLILCTELVAMKKIYFLLQIIYLASFW
jgi:hypothetical protein